MNKRDSMPTLLVLFNNFDILNINMLDIFKVEYLKYGMDVVRVIFLKGFLSTTELFFHPSIISKKKLLKSKN
jgi:hypothetical protein